ncbi:MAG: PfkB family carbohydrate kinase [Planctomycetota bacterium]
MPDVVALGELIIDFLSTDTDAGLAKAEHFTKAPGGAPANVAVAVVRLGKSAGFIGRVGDDPFGRFLAEVIAREGVDVTGLRFDPERRTTLAMIATRSDGSKDITFWRNPGADMFLSKGDIPEEMVRRARAFHFGSISMIDEGPREATLHGAKLARGSGCLVSYDPNYRPALWNDAGRAREIIRAGFERADVAKVSEEEWEFVTGCDGFEEGAKRILERGVKLVLVSRGEKGAAFFTRKTSGAVEGFRVEVAETIGAGDAFTGSVLVDLIDRCKGARDIEGLAGADLEGIVRRANAAGALTCTKYGAIPALPTREEVSRFLQDRT